MTTISSQCSSMHTSDPSRTSSSFPKHSQFFRYVRVCRVGIVISFLYVEMRMKVREQFTFFLFRFFFAYISVAHLTSHYQQRPRMVAERKNGSSQRRNAQQEDKKKGEKIRVDIAMNNNISSYGTSTFWRRTMTVFFCTTSLSSSLR